MKYQHVVRYIASTPWAMQPEKIEEILAVLAFRASDQSMSAADLAALSALHAGPAPVPSPGRDVAIVPIRGVIAHRMGGMDAASGGTSTEAIGAMLRSAWADPAVGTVLLDIDSPGGTVTGVQELAAEMFAHRGDTRMIAVVNGLAASAAYWLASQADEIVSLPSGIAGSIGVYAAHEDVSAALAKEGIAVTLISAGKYKTESSPFAPLSPEAKAVMQGRVDAAYGQFVGDVARGRGVTASAVRGGYGEGRVLSAPEALAAGLIDRIATLDRVLAPARASRGRSALAALL